MRKATKTCSQRKEDKTSKTLTDIDGEDAIANKGFNACYLLTSLSPRHKGHTYIGFTVNPKRRIRQHNGEITSGATRTKKKRPWEMILCIYGFPTQVAALQFEWAWQHPVESLAVRKAACNLKSLNGLPNKIKVAFTMLTLHAWQSMDLTVNFFSTKYMTHVADCPSVPRQMKVQFGSMDDLPCYSSDNQSFCNDENNWDLDPQECSISDDDIEHHLRGSSNPADENSHCFDAIGADAISPDNQKDKEPQQSQENDALEQRGSFLLGEGNDFQNHFNEDSRYNQLHPFEGRAPLSNGDSFTLIEDDDCQKQFYEDSGYNLAQSFKERSPLPRGATDETQLSTFKQIEVIDLFTPSPDCKKRLHNKKRKVDSADTDIIDLTRSPDFVQL